MSAPSGIVIRLLGRFEVIRDGAPIPPTEFGGRKGQVLLRILASRRGQFFPHDVLIGFLWPDRVPADPAANLHVLVNRLRRAIGSPGLIRTGSGGYALDNSADCEIDTEGFLAAIAACAKITGPGSLPAYRAALAQFTGEPLAEDRYAAWASSYRELLFRVRQQALERAADLAVQQDDPIAAVEFATIAAETEPLREIAALTLIRSLAAAGDRVAALAHYERYRLGLADELGLDPSPAAAALQAALLVGQTDHPLHRKTASGNDFDFLPFVGRHGELRQARAALGDPAIRLITIAGGSGSGKTRLIAQIAARAPSIYLRAYWAERNEQWALGAGLLRAVLAADRTNTARRLSDPLRAALGTILPERGAARIAPANPESRRALLVEAAQRMFAACPGMVVLVDDLQWADASSIHLLASLHDRRAPLRLVAAYRPDELDRTSEVAAFLRQADIPCTITLTELDEDAIGQLVGDREVAAALADSTDRSPLAVSEVVRSLVREGLLQRDAAGSWRSSPIFTAAQLLARTMELGISGQRRALQRRADQQSPVGLEIVRAMSLLGRRAATSTLGACVDADHTAVLDALDVLTTAGLASFGQGGWMTAHDMVAEVVSGQLTDAERSRLHGRLATVLLAEHAEPAELARHLLGAGDPVRAAAAFADAAALSLNSFADADAVQQADAGLAADPTDDVAARLLAARAEARRRRGEIARARRDLGSALGRSLPGPARAGLLADLARLESGSDDLVRAAELAEVAIVEAGGDAAARAQALEIAAVLDMNLDRSVRSAERASEALAIYQQLGSSAGAARILDARAMAAFLNGEISSGTELLHRAANLFLDSGDLIGSITPRSTRGHGLVLSGQPQQGCADAELALETARTLGHAEGQTYALWHLAEALAALGQGGAAVEMAREALAIADRIGHRGWTATAWRAMGIAQQIVGDQDAALHAFSRSLEWSAHLDLFGCWAAARSALVLCALGRLDDAAPMVRLALSQGPPLGQYEGRWARTELAVRRSAPNAGEIAADALSRTESGGALLYRPALLALQKITH